MRSEEGECHTLSSVRDGAEEPVGWATAGLLCCLRGVHAETGRNGHDGYGRG